MNDFNAISAIYDSFNEDARYDEYCSFIIKSFSEYSRHPAGYQPRAVDLCCGTGEMALRLAREGFDVVGVDRSDQMLQSASQKAFSEPELALFFVRQDMRRLKMDAKANLFVCCYDSLNYLSSAEELDRVFRAVSEHLSDTGVFIFDLNSHKRFSDYYADKQFVFRRENGVLIWESRFDNEKQICEFDVDIFAKNGSQYIRSGEKLKQKYFSDEEVFKALENNSLKAVSRIDESEIFPGKEKEMRSVWITLR